MDIVALTQHVYARWQALRWPPYWTGVRSVSNTGVVRVVILIPIVGYWIILNDQILSLVTFSQLGASPQTVPLRLFATYFGLCFVGVGSSVYQWKCRDEVKRYGSGVDYIAAVLQHLSNIEEDRIVQALRDGDEASRAVLEEITAHYSSSRAEIKSDADLREHRKENFRRDLLQAHYDLCNRQPKWARYAVGICYTLGGSSSSFRQPTSL
jgi:hypothetical protein